MICVPIYCASLATKRLNSSRIVLLINQWSFSNFMFDIESIRKHHRIRQFDLPCPARFRIRHSILIGFAANDTSNSYQRTSKDIQITRSDVLVQFCFCRPNNFHFSTTKRQRCHKLWAMFWNGLMRSTHLGQNFPYILNQFSVYNFYAHTLAITRQGRVHFRWNDSIPPKDLLLCLLNSECALDALISTRKEFVIRHFYGNKLKYGISGV